jgi:hypothetical protein
LGHGFHAVAILPKGKTDEAGMPAITNCTQHATRTCVVSPMPHDRPTRRGRGSRPGRTWCPAVEAHRSCQGREPPQPTTRGLGLIEREGHRRSGNWSTAKPPGASFVH